MHIEKFFPNFNRIRPSEEAICKILNLTPAMLILTLWVNISVSEKTAIKHKSHLSYTLHIGCVFIRIIRERW